MQWEELSSKEHKAMVGKCGGVCLLPIGAIEKHGNHLPVGTDMFIGRAVTQKAAEIEPAVVFPYYFFGQVSECKHYAGCLSASHEMLMASLLEMCDEIARNGYKKIIIVSSHGGNNCFVNFFAQKMPSLNKDYVVYTYTVWSLTDDRLKKINDFTGLDHIGDHAGLSETSQIMYLRPDLVHKEAQDPYAGGERNMLKSLKSPEVFSGLTWYGDFPEHYAGDHTDASPELGKLVIDMYCENLCEVIRNVKADNVTPALFKAYNENAANPL